MFKLRRFYFSIFILFLLFLSFGLIFFFNPSSKGNYKINNNTTINVLRTESTLPSISKTDVSSAIHESAHALMALKQTKQGCELISINIISVKKRGGITKYRCFHPKDFTKKTPKDYSKSDALFLLSIAKIDYAGYFAQELILNSKLVNWIQTTGDGKAYTEKINKLVQYYSRGDAEFAELKELIAIDKKSEIKQKIEEYIKGEIRKILFGDEKNINLMLLFTEALLISQFFSPPFNELFEEDESTKSTAVHKGEVSYIRNNLTLPLRFLEIKETKYPNVNFLPLEQHFPGISSIYKNHVDNEFKKPVVKEFNLVKKTKKTFFDKNINILFLVSFSFFWFICIIFVLITLHNQHNTYKKAQAKNKNL